jgi:radical SAM superfamily enzyme YgiQ (UPF0313 family)
LNILQAFPWIDAIVTGEGEETIRHWVRALRAGGGRVTVPIPGMLSRGSLSINHGGKRTRIRNLDDIRPPAYHLINWKRYTTGRIITTRGCSYRCSFCDVAALWSNRSTFRSIDRTIGEMAELRQRWGVQAIGIADDTFVLNVRRVREFCSELIRGNYNFKWGCFGRINLMTPELIELMAAAGCQSIFYGIDSGSPRILERTVKRVNADAVIPILQKSWECFDTIEASFIWGYPFETLDDFRLTIELAAQASFFAPKVNVQLHLLSPMPNSPIYREFAEQLCAPDEADRRYLLLPGMLLDERAGTVRTIIERAPSLFPGFYALPTQEKEAKRAILEESVRAMHEVLGATLFEPAVACLLHEDAYAVEATLLKEEANSARRIGVGLALGALRRKRRAQRAALDRRYRSPGFVRQRNETPC